MTDAARLTIKLPSGEVVVLTFPVLAAMSGFDLSAPVGTTLDWRIASPDALGVISVDAVEGRQDAVK
ncbi:MAG: hypothetical protein Q7R39_17095, partial [Dehalococcoidia bacterium]|nr:hypothetical protein [Dehalococcoidia bacterium]